MRILAFSDSHKDYESIAAVMKRFYPDAVIHLGDGTDDLFVLEKDFPLAKFFYVKGNSGEPDTSGEPDRVITLENVSIFLSHINRFKVKKDRNMIDEALKLDVQIVLYGDSHTPELLVSNGITFMNPGSISKEFGFRTFGLIDVFEGAYSCEVVFADLFMA